MQVKVFVNNISAERFWEVERPIPAVQVATNLNVIGVNEKSEDILEVRFVFTVNYTPAVAHISLKGKSHVTGSKDEIQQVLKSQKERTPPPQVVIQSISNIVFIESVIICKSLNIPPPIPLPKIAATNQKKVAEPTYRA